MDEKELRAKLIAERGEGNTVFASTKWTGLMAFRKTTEEEYLDHLGAVVSPHESAGVSVEQTSIGCMVYPVEKEEVAKVRRLFKAKPSIPGEIFAQIEALACGDFDELNLDKKADSALIAELDAKHEFGWGGLDIAGFGRVILATSETAGTLVRVASDARQRGDSDNGRKVRAAVLAMIKSHDVASVEALLADRPALLIPLWNVAREQAGLGTVELGKG